MGSKRNITLIARRDGAKTTVDLGGSGAVTPLVRLMVHREDPGTTTSALVLDTWANFPAGDPTSGYEYSQSASDDSLYELSGVAVALVEAALYAGGRYRFEIQWVNRSETMRQSRVDRWETEPPAGMTRNRALLFPARFGPSVNGVAVDIDQVTLSGVARVRAGLRLVNLTSAEGSITIADVTTWPEAASTGTPSAWSGATTYTIGNVADNGAYTWVALDTTTNEQPNGAPAWSAVTAYVANDLVILSGVVYRCILGHTNQSPPNSIYWTPIWSRITTTASSGNSLPTYSVQKIRDGWYGLSDADATTVQASLINGNKYEATWTYMNGGVTYSSTSTFVHQAPGRQLAPEKRFYGKNFGQIKQYLFTFLGDNPATMSSDDLVNEATLAFFQDVPWAFSEADTTYLDAFADENFLELPDDFGSIRVFRRANDNTHTCVAVSAEQMADLRERDLIHTSNITYYYVRSEQPRDDATSVKRKIEIYPTPSTTTPGAYRLDYGRIPPLMVDDADIPPIPVILIPLYLQFVRMYAAEVENDESLAQEKARYDRMLAGAVDADERQASPFLGPMTERCVSSGDGTGTFSYLPVDPDQGPTY